MKATFNLPSHCPTKSTYCFAYKYHFHRNYPSYAVIEHNVMFTTKKIIQKSRAFI